MKKLRALLRLVREKELRSESAFFRDVARELAGARDADVMLATLGDLEERYGELPGMAKRLRPALVAHRFRTSAGSLRPASTAAVATLMQARARVEDWPLETDGFDAFEDGLRRSYRRGRRDYQAAREQPSAENVHEWRKRVKDLWYHLRLVRDARPGPLGKAADRAHELSDLLGDHHDLAVLLEDVGRRPAVVASEDRAILEELVERRQRELLAAATSLAGNLYDGKPKRFVGRIGKYWAAWR
jgi:CHAD domain-containing protein